MAEPVLLEARHEGVVTLTLNRPQAMNALSSALRAALTSRFRALADDPDVRVVILTGAGERAFCAGLDLKELSGEGERPSDGDAATLDGGGMIGAITAFDRPVIAAVNGVAVTGGFELALACDVLIASESARFADTHARVGLVPGWGLSQRLPRLIGPVRAKTLSFTGNYLSAAQALAWGLVAEVTPPAALLARANALAADMVSCIPEVLREIKRVVDAGYATTLSEGLELERKASRASAHLATPEKIAERRKAIFERGRSQKG